LFDVAEIETNLRKPSQMEDLNTSWTQRKAKGLDERSRSCISIFSENPDHHSELSIWEISQF
jgi:hypothetical protein